MIKRDFIQGYEKHLNESERQGVNAFAERVREATWLIPFRV
jgi:hypothetical protein